MRETTIFLDVLNLDLVFCLEIKAYRINLKFLKILTYIWIIQAQEAHHTIPIPHVP